MKKINAIFARGINGEFGTADGKLPWPRNEDDMKRFKSLTMGNVVVMGKRTFDSIGRFLPGRINIVIDRNTETNSLEAAISNARKYEKDIYVIGGARILKELFDKKYVDGFVYETVFSSSFANATLYIEEFNKSDFCLAMEEEFSGGVFRDWKKV